MSALLDDTSGKRRRKEKGDTGLSCRMKATDMQLYKCTAFQGLLPPFFDRLQYVNKTKQTNKQTGGRKDLGTKLELLPVHNLRATMLGKKRNRAELGLIKIETAGITVG